MSLLTLGECFELQKNMDEDRQRSHKEILGRDQQIGSYLRGEGLTPNSSGIWLKKWIKLLSPSSTLHEQIDRGVAQLSLAVIIGMILLGFLCAKALLTVSTQQPVQILRLFGYIFIPQFLLLLQIILFTKFRDAKAGATGLAGVFRFVLKKTHRSWPESIFSPSVRGLWSARVFRLSQMGALAFNLTLVLSALFIMSTTDLAFAWGTTIPYDLESLHKFFYYWSLPWSFIDVAVPSLELIQSSQYKLVEERYLAQAAHISSGAQEWWAFFLASLVFYGVGPRLISLSAGILKERRHIRRFTERLEHKSLLDRLQSSAQIQEDSEFSVSSQTMTAEPEHSHFVVFTWRHLPLSQDLSHVRQELKLSIEVVHELTPPIESQMFPKPRENASILVLVESWESLSKALLRAVDQLHKHFQSPIFIGLIEFDAENHASWSYPKTWEEQLRAINPEHCQLYRPKL